MKLLPRNHLYAKLFEYYRAGVVDLKLEIRDDNPRFRFNYYQSWFGCKHLSVYAKMTELDMDYIRTDLINKLPSRWMFFVDPLTRIDYAHLRFTQLVIFDPRKPRIALFDIPWRINRKKYIPSHIVQMKPILEQCDVKSISIKSKMMFDHLHGIARELDHMLFGYQ